MPAKSFKKLKLLVATCTTLSIVGCASIGKPRDYANLVKAASMPTSTMAYDWKKILPGPPAADSPQSRFELDAVKSLQSEQNSPRRLQAKSDNGIDAFAIYGPILGEGFTVTQKPEIAALLTYAGRQLARNTNNAKDNFPRPRPFLTSPEIKICIDNPPGGSSYPSGHAAWGWLSAQILARIFPKQASEILGRGIDYGQSRIICGVHYPSDVSDGRLVGDAILLALDRDPEFQRLLNNAFKSNPK